MKSRSPTVGANAQRTTTGIEIALHDAGMSPILRAGLGGLSASLRAIERMPVSAHPPGTWGVSKHTIMLDWSKSNAADFLACLFDASFAVAKDGLMAFPGMYAAVPPPLEVRSALQDALRQTILQHGKWAKKLKGTRVHQYSVDEQPYQVEYQPYESFKHQTVWQSIAKQLAKPRDKQRPITLPGWASPGAVQRHVAFASTKAEYSPAQALCACFAIVGTLSYLTPFGGALVIPEPADLLQFARSRARITPTDVRGTRLAGTGDAVLAVALALRAEGVGARSKSVEQVSAYAFRPTAWASQQKSRVASLKRVRASDHTLQLYEQCAAKLPARIIVTSPKKNRAASSFTVASALRGFVCDNLARGRAWFADFATARDMRERDRFLHYRRRENNNGALLVSDLEGLRTMVEHLDNAELVLVRSVQTAVRQRLGAIAEENRANPAARRNRWNREFERLRLAFAGARTREQVRFALADLWSRAGPIKELQNAWMEVLPLLGEAHWKSARDLALVALASYKGREDVAPDETETTE